MGSSRFIYRIGLNGFILLLLTARFINPLNPNIKIQILICYPYAFSIEVVVEFVEVSVIFILCDHVLNSHDHSFL